MPQDSSYSERNGKHRNWKLYLAAAAFIVGVLAITLFGSYTIYRGQQINKTLCQYSDHNREAIVNILLAVEQNALERASTAADVERITESTDELLALVPPIRCRIGGDPVELERGTPRLRE